MYWFQQNGGHTYNKRACLDTAIHSAPTNHSTATHQFWSGQAQSAVISSCASHERAARDL